MADPPGVSIAFDAVWNAAAPVWTRIDTLTGCRVRSWTVDRGRPDEFSKTDTGTATIRVVDRQGLFDPTNAASPYTGKLLPGRQAMISLLNPVNGTWHTVFRGFIESWRYVLGKTRQHEEVELQLVDGFAQLARRELRPGIDGALPPYTGTADKVKLAEFAQGNVLYGETLGVVGDRVRSILADADWPVDLAIPWDDPRVPATVPVADVFTGNVRVGPKAYAATTALDALWDACDAEFPGVGNLYIDRYGHFVFHGRQARFRPDVTSYGIKRRTVGDDTATAADTNVVPIAELEWMNGNDNLFNAVTATPQGIGSGLAWRPVNPDPPDNDNLAGQLVEDTASQNTYGLRSISFDNLQTLAGKATATNSLVETKLFATYYVQNYKTPATRISRMVFKTRRPGTPNSSAAWEHFCNCEIGDLHTVKTDHPGAGGFNTEFYVEGLHYTCRPGPPEHAIVELSLDVSPRAHYATNPFTGDT